MPPVTPQVAPPLPALRALGYRRLGDYKRSDRSLAPVGASAAAATARQTENTLIEVASETTDSGSSGDSSR